MKTSQKTCQLCGVRFECGGPRCWCMDLPVLREPIEGTADCVCPECLKRELEAKANRPEPMED